MWGEYDKHYFRQGLPSSGSESFGKECYTEGMIRRIMQSVRVAARNLFAAKVRTFLTVLGMVIGIAAVFLVMSIGASVQNFVLSQIRGVGSNLIAILPGASDPKGPPASVFGIVTTTFTNKDLDAILLDNRVPHVVAGTGYVTGSALATFESESFNVSYQGVSADLPRVENIPVASGRFFSTEEASGLGRVAVLGASRAKDLFLGEDPLGKRFSLGDASFTVVGVLEAKGSSGFSNVDTNMYIPLLTAQKILLGIDYLNFARIKIDEERNIPVATKEIETLLRDRHNIKRGEPDDFSIRNTTDAISTLGTVTGVLKYFLAFVAGISLFVGGIGIMNVMLIALKQRIREVGLRKAIGARDADILFQFLIEAMFLSFLGGFFGFLLGVVLTYLSALGIRAAGYEWDFILTFQAAAIAFVVSLAIGISFGLYPARRASKVSPMEALRYE